QVPVGGDVVADRATPTAGHPMLVGRDRDAGVRVAGQQPQRGAATDPLTFPSCGGILTISRSQRPSVTSTNAASIRSRAGVCTVPGSSVFARSPGNTQRRPRIVRFAA